MSQHAVGDKQWHVVDVGSGPALLLVHGFPLDHSMWRAQWRHLSASYRCIVPDLPGFGASQVAEGTLTMAELADDLCQLMDHLDVSQPFVYCGLSMGGYIGWEMWRRHAERLAALIQCDTRAVADTPEVARGRQLMAQSIGWEGADKLAESMLPKLFSPLTRERQPNLIAETCEVMAKTDPRAIAAVLLGMSQRKDFTSALTSIDIPTLLICGEHDAISPPDEMQGIADAMPHGELIRIAEAGHLAPLEQPAAVNAAITAFLAREAGSARADGTGTGC